MILQVYKALKDGVAVVAVKVLPGMDCQRKREDFVREVRPRNSR